MRQKRVEPPLGASDMHWRGNRVEARVESVCQKGCRQVRLDIATLELGGDIPETLGLLPDERGLLLAEIKQIMAVYGDTCRID